MGSALEAFSSLAQETRLRVFKLILEYGSSGITPGEAAELLDVPDNTLSFHLSHLARAKLVQSRREGRSLIYVASTDLVEELIEYLRENCCSREVTSKANKRRHGGKKKTGRKC